jgi:predicted DCC family thiol-disulfide oxidoreductase YuxK
MSQSKSVAIYYDRECAFCKRSVELIVKYGRVRISNIGPAQENPVIYARMQAADSWVVVNFTGGMFTTFQAGVEIAKCSPILKWLVPLTKLKLVQKIGEWTYRKIARNRSKIWLP